MSNSDNNDDTNDNNNDNNNTNTNNEHTIIYPCLAFIYINMLLTKAR